MSPNNKHKLATILKAVDQNLLTLNEWEESFISTMETIKNLPFELSWKRQKTLNKIFAKTK